MKFFGLTIIISLVVGLAAGTFGSLYLAPLLTEKEPEPQPDTFLEIPPLVIEEDDNEDEEEPQKQSMSIVDVVEIASPAVVSVIVSKYISVLDQFRIKKELHEVGGGTGFIISADGLIVTNKHVVYDEDAEYTVLTNDGKKYPAPVLARDPVQDIAILKISAIDLPTVKLGNSDRLRIGQTVITIGNALGEFRNTVSAGVVSGLARSITTTSGVVSEQLDELIQTDAAINQGNSGGPLLNLFGEVIGVNTAMATEAENISFAIPVNKVKKDIVDIQTKGKISYPFFGVRYILINQAIQEKNNLPFDYGALIIRGSEPGEVAVMPGSAADIAGVVENDIILEIGGTRVDQTNTLAKLILKHNVGDKIILKIFHRGEEKIIDAVLGEWE